ncbi:MAG: histidine kinase [Microlunatus sp.]
MVATALVLLGILALIVRLDTPTDGTRVTEWRSGTVIIEVTVPSSAQPGLRTGDQIRAIDSRPVAAGPRQLADPTPGAVLSYLVDRPGQPPEVVPVIVLPNGRGEISFLIRGAWGNLVFVLALALLATALYLRRPDEPATTPLLIAASGLLASTLAFDPGVPAIAQVTGGPMLWLFNLNIVGVYALAWGALLVFGLLFPGGPAPGRYVLATAWVLPPLAMLVLVVGAALVAPDWPGWLALAYRGQGAIVVTVLTAVMVLGVVVYRRSDRPEVRVRLRWVAGGTVLTAALGLGLWQLPELLLGKPFLPPGGLGLSGLPFLVGIGVALGRHRLFDIERLANRSLTYLATTTVLVAAYALAVALLGNVLGLSGGLAAALAAVGAAVALAPLLRLARRIVNRLMYGDRDDPAGVLARLGSRMQAVLLPDDVLPAVVETVAQSLRLPYVAIQLPRADGSAGPEEFQLAVEHGRPIGLIHEEELSHHGTVVGRLQVSARGIDDPLDDADLVLLRSLAGEIGPAVQAVRLHQDLVRSRAQLVALREDERRRLRRDLHDGLGPALAAIGLKAGLARRDVAATSSAYDLLGEIDGEVKASLGGIRRLVEGLRPPALDELGLVGALRTRAATLAPAIGIEVSGDVSDQCLPAAVEAAAYWIAVEAMTNASRHSQGSRCLVDLQLFHHTLVVVVADDGRGIDPTRPSGVGLNSMRERAVEVSGTLVVHAAADGTEVVARLPLDLGVDDGHADPR